MSNRPGQSFPSAVELAQEWQRFGWATMNHAMGHCLRGCANVLMARTPREASAALHEAHSSLLAHSAESFARIARLWHRQNADLRRRP